MPSPHLVLFGAGASHGSRGIVPVPPPLGKDLFATLQRAFPVTWGTIGAELLPAFEQHFEEGMQALMSVYPGAIQDRVPGAPSPHHLMQDMARFFLSFELATAAAAQTPALYGVAGTEDQLIVIDTETGLGSAIGAIGSSPNRTFAFAVSPSGAMYGVVGFGLDVDRLISIDPSTGAGAIIGSIGFTAVHAIAFNSSGVLFGIDSFSAQLLTIDRITGQGTPIGDLGTDGAIVSWIGMAFDSTDMLFGAPHRTSSNRFHSYQSLRPSSSAQAFVTSRSPG